MAILICFCVSCSFDWQICFFSWPSNASNQSDSEGWDAWPTSSSANQNPSLGVPSAQLRQRSAFTPAAMTTGSSPSPVLGQVGLKTALSFVLLLCSLLKESKKKKKKCNFLSARERKLRVSRLRPCIPGGQRRITTSTSTKMKYIFTFQCMQFRCFVFKFLCFIG